MNSLLSFDFHTWLLATILLLSRLGPIFFMLPFFHSSVLSGTTRNTVMMLIAVGFLRAPSMALVNIDTFSYVAAIAGELFIGVGLGILLASPFWIFQAVGSFIDNQRGGTLSASVDPANGVDTSEFSAMFDMFATVVYLQGGGLILLVGIINDSYLLCHPLQTCTFSSIPILGVLNNMVTHMIVIAAPVVAVLLLSEFTLGLLSRFAPQLNAFSLSLTIKSVMALVVLLIYLGPVFPDELKRLGLAARNFPWWFGER